MRRLQGSGRSDGSGSVMEQLMRSDLGGMGAHRQGYHKPQQQGGKQWKELESEIL